MQCVRYLTSPQVYTFEKFVGKFNFGDIIRMAQSSVQRAEQADTLSVSQRDATSIAARLEEMRKKLLDLSLRNNLLNFRHSEKSQAHIRIIDELPDQLYETLLSEKELIFKPLPEYDNEPQDEKTSEFQGLYKQYSITDEAYLKDIEAAADKEDPFDSVAKADRKLKDRIRIELGLPTLAEIKTLSNSEWAKQNGIDPKYDMPEAPKSSSSKVQKKHTDDYIQTLLKPKELAHKLLGIKRYINTDINETGVNTFFCVFGFLQWQDSENSDKNNFAPLVVVQLDPINEKKQSSGTIKYSIRASGEEPQHNLPLMEKLKQFNVVLPEYLLEEDTPEKYFLKIEKAIKNFPRWRVRRFITLGRLQFSKLIMYKDLDPSIWPSNQRLTDHNILQTLLIGKTEKGGQSEGSVEVYDIDRSDDVEKYAPVLVTEADSSQHSAIVDVIKGKNLVIQGPPGTGKSQTITNLIANAISQGKRVLFVAEKMAALNVVYSRLQDAGLGDYCLELHSTKTKLKDIRHSLEERISNGKKAPRPKDLNEKIAQLKKLRSHLRTYSDILGKISYGALGKSVYDLLWLEQAKRGIGRDIHTSIKRTRIARAHSITQENLNEYRFELDHYERIKNSLSEFSNTRHPWQGIGLQKASSLLIQETIDLFSEWRDSIKLLISAADKIESFRLPPPVTLQKINDLHSQLAKIDASLRQSPDLSFLSCFVQEEAFALHAEMLSHLELLNQSKEEIRNVLKNPNSLINQHDEFWEFLTIAQKEEILNNNQKACETTLDSLQKIESKFSTFSETYAVLCRLVFGESSINVQRAKLLHECGKVLSGAERSVLLKRQASLFDENNLQILEGYEHLISSYKELTERLGKIFDLKSPHTISEINNIIKQVSGSGLFSFCNGDYRGACKSYKSIRLEKPAESKAQKLEWLRDLKRHKELITSFVQDERLRTIAGKFYAGVDTDLSALSEVTKWAIDVKKSIHGFEPNHKSARDFILSAEIDAVDHFLSVWQRVQSDTAEAIEYMQTTGGDSESLDNLSVKLKTKIDSLQSAIDFLKKHAAPGCTGADIKKVIETHYKNAEESVNWLALYDSKLKNNLGNSYKGHETDVSIHNSTHALCELVFALPISRAEISYLLKETLPESIGLMLAEVKILEKMRDDVISCGTQAMNAAKLDMVTYIGLSEFSQADLGGLLARIENSLHRGDTLGNYIEYNNFFSDNAEKPYLPVLEALEKYDHSSGCYADIFEYLFIRSLVDRILGDEPILDSQSGLKLKDIRDQFAKLDREIIAVQRLDIAHRLSKNKPPEGISYGNKSDYTQMGLIDHQIQGRPRSIPLRQFINRAGSALQVLKPCFLMSPMSVAQYISPDSVRFDIMVIDEASQMRPEEALGAIARCGQIVVVGDHKQLPPTAFFQKQVMTDEDYEEEDSLDNESILDLVSGRYYPARQLMWHYRSRHESLIAFSNSHFYNNNLILFPACDDKDDFSGVHGKYVGSVYNAGSNLGEVEAIVKAAAEFMRKNPGKSLGIATMNAQQQELIDNEMERLFQTDPYAEAYKSKWADKLEYFFVKNLESVQGDERDVIFISTVYGPDKAGVVHQRFGPVNGKSGERRLNVLFTRAKHGMIIFTSLKPEDIKIGPNSSKGLQAFKGYLEYAFTGKLDTGKITSKSVDSDFELFVKERLEAKGYEVEPQVGVAGFFIDLAVKHPDFPYGFLLGIECDGAAYHSSRSARDRDRLRQQVLEGLGWSIYRIWSTDWFHNSENEMQKLLKYMDDLLKIKKDRWQKEQSLKRAQVGELSSLIKSQLEIQSKEQGNLSIMHEL